MTNRLLDILADLDFTRPLSRKDLFRAIGSILTGEIAGVSDTEIRKGVGGIITSPEKYQGRRERLGQSSFSFSARVRRDADKTCAEACG